MSGFSPSRAIIRSPSDIKLVPATGKVVKVEDGKKLIATGDIEAQTNLLTNRIRPYSGVDEVTGGKKLIATGDIEAQTKLLTNWIESYSGDIVKIYKSGAVIKLEIVNLDGTRTISLHTDSLGGYIETTGTDSDLRLNPIRDIDAMGHLIKNVGTVDGVDISAHDHGSATAQTRLASKDRKRQAQVRIPASIAGDIFEKAIFSAPEACTITKVGIISDTTLTGQDTNYATIKLVDKGSDGSGTDVIGSRDYTLGNNATAFDLDDNYGVLANTSLVAGDVVSIKKEITLTGLATPDLVAIVEYIID